MINLIGQRLGHYTIVELLGRGGMGAVYLAQDTHFSRQVAVKILPLEAAQEHELLQRFQREANAAATLEHPNIIDVYDLGQETGMYYIVMRYINGPALCDVLEKEGVLPPLRVLRVVEQLVSALDHAHQRGIIHRDIKPANIMLEPDDFVTLTDFGIAYAPGPEKLTQMGQVMGTAGYMAPEQASGRAVDHRVDIYALGVLIEEMLIGQRPEFGQPPSPILPDALRKILARSRAKRVADRYPSVRALGQDLRPALINAPILRRTGPLKLVLHDGREYPLTPGALRMGRAPDCDVVLRDEQVSRCHAEIRTDQRGSVLIDLNSSNGTFVNAQRLSPRKSYPIAEGVRVQMGQHVLARIAYGVVARPVDDRLSMETQQRAVLQTVAAQKPSGASTAAQEKVWQRLPRWAWGVIGAVALVGLLIVGGLATGIIGTPPTVTLTPTTTNTLPATLAPVQDAAPRVATASPTLTGTPTRAPTATPAVAPTRAATPRPSATPQPDATTVPPTSAPTDPSSPPEPSAPAPTDPPEPAPTDPPSPDPTDPPTPETIEPSPPPPTIPPP